MTHTATASDTGAGVHVTSETSELSTNDLNEQLQQLYVTHYKQLTDVAYSTHPGLLVFDAEKVMLSLGDQLSRYKGNPESEPFLKWATKYVQKETKRYKLTEEILRTCRLIIYKAIHDSLWTTATNRAVEIDDIFSEVAFRIFQTAHSLSRTGTAKLSTRIYALTEKHCYLYHNSKNARQRSLVEKSIEKGVPVLVERLSEEELASLHPAPGYDPGYAECGLLE